MSDQEQKYENIATCSPTKALAQCYKISKKLEEWITATDILNIRKRVPDLLEVPKIPDEKATEREKEEEREKTKKAINENKKRIDEQSKKNLFAILESVLDKHPNETLDLLAMCCFVEPEDKDKHPLPFYLGAMADIMENKEILRFFSSSVRLMLNLSKTV